MIEGLHVDVSSAELKEMLVGRLKYHQEKTIAYERQLTELLKLHAGFDEEARRISKTSNQGPQESLESAIKRHRDQAIFYRFVSEHVVPSEIYRLAENDLVRLGVLGNQHHY